MKLAAVLVGCLACAALAATPLEECKEARSLGNASQLLECAERPEALGADLAWIARFERALAFYFRDSVEAGNYESALTRRLLPTAAEATPLRASIDAELAKARSAAEGRVAATATSRCVTVLQGANVPIRITSGGGIIWTGRIKLDDLNAMSADDADLFKEFKKGNSGQLLNNRTHPQVPGRQPGSPGVE